MLLMNKKYNFFLISLLIIFTNACSNTLSSHPESIDDGLVVATPESQNMIRSKLNRAANQIHQFKYKSATPAIDKLKKYIGIESILVAKNNKLIFEKYFNGASRNTPHNVASLGKSVISAMFGVAIDKGYINSEEDSLYQYMPYKSYKNWDEQKQQITLKHLLTMSAGWDCGNISEYSSHCGAIMIEKNDPFKWVLDLPMAGSPGEIFNYNDAIPRFISTIITMTSQQDIAHLYSRTLMQPMKMTTNIFLTQSLTSREMMKLGLLYLNNGKWNDKQLISEQWITKSTSRIINFREGSSATGYGYFWWQNKFDIEGVIYHSYYALGNGGQYIIVIPELNLVSVFTGNNYNSMVYMNQVFDIMKRYIIPSAVFSRI